MLIDFMMKSEESVPKKATTIIKWNAKTILGKKTIRVWLPQTKMKVGKEHNWYIKKSRGINIKKRENLFRPKYTVSIRIK